MEESGYDVCWLVREVCLKAQSFHTKGATGVCIWSLTQPVLQTRLHTLAAARTENHEEAVLEVGATE